MFKKGDVVCDKRGRVYLVCCSGDCGAPMLAYEYHEDEHDRGMSFKYVSEGTLEYVCKL